MAIKYSKSVHEIMLNWGLRRGYALIPKSEKLDRQKANMACLDFKLSDEDVKAITETCDKNERLFIGPGPNGGQGGTNLFS
jgi:diketogulonate reductase-like aldo/keto reductase